MEVLEVLGSSAVVGVGFPLDTSHHFRNKHKVNDQWGGEKRVFADIEDPTILELHLIHMEEDATHEIVWWPPKKISA